MENILIDGDYVADRLGNLQQADGIQALLVQALFRLNCRRGSFPFLPELGSRLWQLKGRNADEIEQLAMAYCSEALEPMGLRVCGVMLQTPREDRIRLDVQLAIGRRNEHVEVEL